MARKSPAVKFTKAVLRVGETMQSPDGAVPITAERLKNFAEQHTRLKSAGYVVPSRWEHADDTADMIPLAAEDLPKRLDGRHAVGDMSEFKLAPDGQSAELTLAVSDKRAIEQCEANRVKVSPIIAAWWKDGRGNEYRDFLSHADLVERPVDYTQGPFVRQAEEAEKSGMIACSLEKYVRLADEFPPKKKDGDGDGETGEGEEGAPPEVEAPSEPAKNPDAPPKATDKTKAAAVLDGLATKGIILPSDFDFSGDSALDILLAAINSSVAADVKAEESKQQEQEEEQPETVASPGYAAMSTETKAAVEYANRLHRERVKSDLDELLKTGRCKPCEVTERETALTAVRLSLDSTTSTPIASDLEKWIESRKAVPAGTFWSDEQKTKLSTEAAPPYKSGTDQTPDEINAAVDDQLRRTGRLAAK